MKRNDQHDEYEDLARLMLTAQRLKAPQDFTQNVMGRIAQEVSLVHRVVQCLFLHFLYAPIVSSHTGYRQCSFCFLLAGSFYFLLGIVLLAGLNLSDTVQGHWISLVPWFNIGAALWLLVLGMIVVSGGRWSWGGAKAGTILFVFFFIFGAVVFAKADGTPVMYIFAAMSWLSACMGVLLYYQVAAFSDTEVDVDNNTRVTT